MSRHTKRLLLASAIIMASPLSIAQADGQAGGQAHPNNANPWSPNYQAKQFAPQQNMQTPQFQYNNQQMMPWGNNRTENNGTGNNNRGNNNQRNGFWGGGPWSDGPWNNNRPPMMNQQSRPPMPPPQMNKPNNAPAAAPNRGPGNRGPANSGPRNGMAPPPGWNPNNAQRMNAPRMNNGMRPPGYYTPGYNQRNDRWGNNNNFWGRSGPSTWMNPNKQNMEQGWDDMINAPSRMGEMPGGWTAPEVSMPNPIDMGDQMQDNLQDLPEQMRNMDVGN